jgi:hypothetical protein
LIPSDWQPRLSRLSDSEFTLADSTVRGADCGPERLMPGPGLRSQRCHSTRSLMLISRRQESAATPPQPAGPPAAAGGFRAQFGRAAQVPCELHATPLDCGGRGVGADQLDVLLSASRPTKRTKPVSFPPFLSPRAAPRPRRRLSASRARRLAGAHRRVTGARTGDLPGDASANITRATAF